MNDFEKRLSDISHGIAGKIDLPDAELLLDTAKKESATKGKKIERRNALRRNFIPAVAMMILSTVFISGVYYYITHGSLRNPGSPEPSTQSSTEQTTKYNGDEFEGVYPNFMSESRAKVVFSELMESYIYIEDKWTVTGAGDYIFAHTDDYVIRYNVSENKIDRYLNLHSQDNYVKYDEYNDIVFSDCIESLSADFTVSSDGQYGIVFMYSDTEFVSDALCFVVNFENQEVSFVAAPYHKSDFPEEIRDDLVFGHYNDNEDTGEINSVKLINEDFSFHVNEDAANNPNDALYYAKHKDGTKTPLSCLNGYEAQKIRGYSEDGGILNAVLGKMDQKGGSYYFVSVDIKKNKLISEKQITTIPFDSLLYSQCEVLSDDKIISLSPVDNVAYLGNYQFVTVDIETDTATQSCPIPILDNTDIYLEDTFAESMFRPMGFEYMPTENLFNCGLTPVCENELWGYINQKGEMVIPAKFSLATSFNPDFEYAIASYTGGDVVIDTKGDYIVPPKYSMITEITDYSNPGIPNGFFILKTETEDTTLYGLADTNGVIIKPKYEYIDYIFSDGLVIFQENGKFGYLNKKGEVVIEAKFSKAELFCNGLAPVTFDEYGKWGYINQKGETVINPQFDYAEPFAFSKKVTPVRINEKWGLINNKGEYIANPQFDSVLPLSDNFLAVSKNSKEGLVDIDGNFVLEPKYDYVSECYYSYDSDGPEYLMASLDGMSEEDMILDVDVAEKLQIFDYNGKLLTEITASDIEFVNDEIFIFEIDFKYGLANINGEIIIEAKCDDLLCIGKNSERLFASTGSNYSVIDLKGNVLKDLDCDYIDFSIDDITTFNKDDKFGIINSDGEILAEAEFMYLEPLFYENLPILIAQKGDKYGAVDLNGNYLIEAKYDYVYGFADNYFIVDKDGLYAIFCYDGKKCTQITDMKYSMISDLLS